MPIASLVQKVSIGFDSGFITIETSKHLTMSGLGNDELQVYLTNLEFRSLIFNGLHFSQLRICLLRPPSKFEGFGHSFRSRH